MKKTNQEEHHEEEDGAVEIEEESIALVGGSLLDVRSGEFVNDSIVICEGRKITGVGDRKSISTPGNAKIVDVSGKVLLPGLMDLHVHLCAEPGSGGAGDYASPDKLFTPGTYLALWGAHHARLSLEAGFTTLRDAFAFHKQTEVLSVRRGIEEGIFPGPRIVAAGYAGMTGGLVEMRIPPEIDFPDGCSADGPWELRRRVRQLVRDGFDWIKTINSGGRTQGRQEEDVWYNNLTLEEMKAIVEEAHTFDVKVMSHASTRDSIKLALDAGADTIEHGWPLDEELIEEMIKRGTFLVPTISVYSERGFLKEDGGIDPALRARAKNQFENRMKSFRRAFEAGVKIAMGSDIAPALPTMRFGENAFELEMMVRQGMKPVDAIRSATIVAAEALGSAQSMGSIEPEKIADITIVKGNPLEDITVIVHGVTHVIKDGKLVVDKQGNTAMTRTAIAFP